MDTVLQAGVVSAPLQVIIDRLSTLTVRETSLILGVDDEVRDLRRTLQRIKTLAAHAEIYRNEAWKVWLEDVEDLLYSADNLLDEISLDLSKHRSIDVGDNEVRNMIISSFRLTVPHEVNSIRQQLEDMYKEMELLYVFESKNPATYPKSANLMYGMSSFVNEECVVGLEDDKNRVLDMLLDEGSLDVIPLVGMGGIGKTTLAQIVYNSDRLEGVDEVLSTEVDMGGIGQTTLAQIVDNSDRLEGVDEEFSTEVRFDVKMWVSVSVDFDIFRITKMMIECVSGKKCKLLNLDSIQVSLQNLIRGKRFLLVLDDYWREECHDWDVLIAPLRVAKKGSKIVVTTRSLIVSQIVCPTGAPYFLNGLSDQDCWKLLKQRACLNNGRTIDSEMEEIGNGIARKCKGLPLGAKILGSMLSFSYTRNEWKSVLESEIWELPRDKNDIFPALLLSYYQLPTHLKACFTYCSLFPKNYEFEIKELVLMWMAQGFICPNGKSLLEDIGSGYFDNLHWRSFFQSLETDGGHVYKMHDLIHDMAKLIIGNRSISDKINRPNEDYAFFKNTRYFSIRYQSRQVMELKGCNWYKHLRAFRVISENVGKVKVSYELFSKIKFLRELDLSRMGLDQIPESISSLKLLRYLNLSENYFKNLPESFTNLFGLQTLKLEKCARLVELPREMRSMFCLRHLHADLKRFKYMPYEFGKLVNLQSLSAFIVGKNKGYGIEELKNMSFLRGSICIKKLENVSSLNDAKEAMLHQKPFLERLELEWTKSTHQNNEEAILSGLRPHENLKELLLKNYGGILLPGWFDGPLCKLSNITLQSCMNYRMLTSLGKLQHLKCLLIEDMPNWVHIGVEFTGFQRLERLGIKHIPDLISWIRLDGFSSLQMLDVDDCPKLNNLPSLVPASCLRNLNISRCQGMQSLPENGLPTSLQALEISECDIIKGRCRVEEGDDWHLIRLIPSIKIDFEEITREMRRF